MNYDDFYAALFAPVERAFGPADRNTLTSVIGFSAGGPVSTSTFRAGSKEGFVTYVTCELTQYEEQGTEASPPFELMISTDDRDLAVELLTALGSLSMEADLGPQHTIDVSGVISVNSTVAGVFLEQFAEVTIENKPYAILRCIGITANELQSVQHEGVASVVRLLSRAGIYPHTPAQRKSVV